MRPIDGDELLEILAGMMAVCSSHAELVGISKVWQQVKHMPTIDAEPVRHTNNIGTDYNEVDQFVCSECGIELLDRHRVERDDEGGIMTYIESYRQCKTVEEIKQKAVQDTKIAIFIGNNPDRIKAIEDAMNQAMAERKEE